VLSSRAAQTRRKGAESKLAEERKKKIDFEMAGGEGYPSKSNTRMSQSQIKKRKASVDGRDGKKRKKLGGKTYNPGVGGSVYSN